MKKNNAFRTYCVNAGQLHADVEHRNGDDLPADGAVREQAANRDSLNGGQRALFLPHLFNLFLDVTFRTVPL